VVHVLQANRVFSCENKLGSSALSGSQIWDNAVESFLRAIESRGIEKMSNFSEERMDKFTS
jgi:hypothetical protein